MRAAEVGPRKGVLAHHKDFVAEKVGADDARILVPARDGVVRGVVVTGGAVAALVARCFFITLDVALGSEMADTRRGRALAGRLGNRRADRVRESDDSGKRGELDGFEPLVESGPCVTVSMINKTSSSKKMGERFVGQLVRRENKVAEQSVGGVLVLDDGSEVFKLIGIKVS